jgi:hypothetical protein
LLTACLKEPAIGYPRVQGMTLEVTPHVNGDASISVQAQLTARRLSVRPGDVSVAGQRLQSASVSAILRVTPDGGWQASRPLFLNFNVKAPFDDSKTLPKMVTVDGKSYPVDRPMYRVEMSAKEVKAVPSGGAPCFYSSNRNRSDLNRDTNHIVNGRQIPKVMKTEANKFI